MTKRNQATHMDEQVSERVRAKFQAFYEALPAEEQLALDLGVARALAGAGGDDTSGYGFGTAPIRILNLWAANIAPPSAPNRLDQEMDHGITGRAAAGCASGEHFPEVKI